MKPKKAQTFRDALPACSDEARSPVGKKLLTQSTLKLPKHSRKTIILRGSLQTTVNDEE